MLKIERIRVSKLASDPIIHGIDVGLIYCHASLSQRRSIVDRNVMEFRVVGPILIEDKEELLCSAKGKGWDEHSPALADC